MMKMKKNKIKLSKKYKQNLIIKIVGFLIITFGLIALNYPYLTGVINDYFSYKDVNDYHTIIDNTSEEELNRQIEMAHQYNQALAGIGSKDFEDFELLKEGAFLGYVEIPQINVYLPVRYSVSDTVLKNGLGLVEDTSLPVGGESVHSVISGHTGMASKKVLTDLTQMRLDDIFFIHSLGQDLAYKVDQIVVVDPWDSEELKIISGEDHCTLLTCTPYGINDHRLLVRGIRIDYDFSSPEIEVDTEVRISEVERMRRIIAMCSVVLYIAILCYVIVSLVIDTKRENKRRKKKANEIKQSE